jgi:hypothetical protein
MIRKFLCLVLVALSFFSLYSSAQVIDSMMKVYAEKYPQEKLYLQFDKKAYNPGERIWYKAYLFTGFDPSPYSKNFYAELYDASGNLILRNTAPIRGATATGAFDIPASFEGTRIRVRAYTTWMLNFDTSFVFMKDLRIISPSADSGAHADPSPTVLNFFPEGGDLVAGVENDIAFKAEDAFGQPRKLSGILYDQSGKTVLSFSTTHNGMGKFLLAPEKQDVFYAVWKDEKAVEHRVDLPAVKTSGVSLRVLNANHKLIFSVARPQESLAYEQVIVIAHMNQQMVYRATVNLKDVFMSGGSIPTDQLPTGVVTVTVFDVNQAPLAERVCFVNNDNYTFDGNITVSSKSLQKRGRNAIDIELPGSVNSDISVAVTDAEVDGNRPWDDNIISSLLLTGDLRGYVKDPYYYFRNGSDSLVQQLDLVMLTHGWRRFKWQDLAKGKSPVIKYPIENYLSLDAEVLGVDVNRISKEESLNIIFRVHDSTNSMLTATMVTPGKFHVGGLIFYDTAKAYYEFNQDKKLSNQAAVIFRNGLYNGARKVRPFAMTMPVWSPDDSSLIRKSRLVYEEIARMQIQDKNVRTLAVVTVKGRGKSDKEKLDEQYSKGLFSGGNASIFDLMDDKAASGYGDIFSYLQSKVAGLSINNTSSTPSLSWRGSTPDLYLDEMQVDPTSLKTIPVQDIAMIKVFSPGSATGLSGGAGGIISVYTRKGKDSRPDPSFKGLDMTRILGYNLVREFYTPDYLINPEPETDDVRTTLYWSPHILGGAGRNKTSISFYNSDVTHQFRVIVEGFNEDGKLIHLEKIIQ